MKSVLIAIVALGLCYAAAYSAPPSEDAIYEGEYFYNFENSYLTPDGKDEEWCIDARSMSKAMLPAKDATGQWGTSHVVVRGKLSARGSYGGLGRCEHVLVVTEIVKVTNMRGRE